MFELFGGLKKLFVPGKINIDNVVCRLHYKATCIVFLTASIMIVSKQYFGDPIDCMVDGVPGDIMDTYCWIHSTYSVPTRYVYSATKCKL